MERLSYPQPSAMRATLAMTRGVRAIPRTKPQHANSDWLRHDANMLTSWPLDTRRAREDRTPSRALLLLTENFAKTEQRARTQVYRTCSHFTP
jgi:hypothetical protein